MFSPLLQHQVFLQSLKTGQLRPAADHRDITRMHTASVDGDSTIAFIGCNHRVSFRKLPLFQPTESAIEEVALAEFREIQLRADIMMIEHKTHAFFLVGSGERPEHIRRIAGVNDIEGIVPPYAFDNTSRLQKAIGKLTNKTHTAPAWRWHGIPIDSHTFDDPIRLRIIGRTG